ncbi:MAG: PEP-CTERM system TPR-repeat protein PrsT [Alphaproteobacteria bacterium]|nr:PEP-CTERM system TPR-repeat protein PrsT [Alphaproteobacteria bacterium]
MAPGLLEFGLAWCRVALRARHRRSRMSAARAGCLGWLLLALLLAPAAAADTRTAGTPTGHYDEALTFYEKGDTRAAIVALKAALVAEPRHLPARVLLGQAYLRNGDIVAAEFELLRAREMGADENSIIVPLAQAYLLQGKAREVLGEFRTRGRPRDVETEPLLLHGAAHLKRLHVIEAEQSFREAAQLRPDYAAPELGLAQALVFRGDVAGAAERVQAARQRDPEHADVWALTGDVRRLQGDNRGAIEAYGMAIARNPSHISARLGRAGALIHTNQNDAAFADVNAILDMLPNEPQAAYLLAVLLARQQRTQNALTVLREVAAIVGGYDIDRLDYSPALLLIGGVAHYLTDNLDQAYTLLSRYRDLVRHNAIANRVLASVLTRRGESQRAVALLEESVGVTGGDVQLLAQLAATYLSQGQYVRATETFERAAAAYPKQAAIRTQLGLARLWGGDSRQAAEDLQQALALDPTSQRAEYLLAVSQLHHHDYAAALTTAERLASREPTNPLAANFRGAAQTGLGDVAAARLSFEQAVTLSPRYLPAQLNLARLMIRTGQPDAARERLVQVLAQNTGSVTAMLELARIDQQLGRLTDAVVWAERARAAAGSDREATALLMDLYVRVSRSEDALMVARDLESLAPDDVDVVEAIGKVELATLRHLRASTTFRRAGELLAGSPEGLHRVANYLLRARDTEGARQLLRRALLVNQSYLPAYAALVEIELGNGNLGEAMRIANEANGAQPAAALGQILRGDVLARQGRLVEAEAAYSSALAREPSSNIVVRLYRIKRDRNQHAAGVKLLEDWLAERPDDPVVRLVLATAHIHAKQPETAIALLERMVADGVQSAAVLNNLAWLYHEKGDSRALAMAERAYALTPDDVATIDTLGWIATHRGDTMRGLNLLREAHARASTDPRVRYHLAVALRRAGRTQEARRELEQALGAGIPFADTAAARALLRQLGSGG